MHSLRGRLILDCSILLPGPFLGRLLATHGARVIKIEDPSRPDPARALAGDAVYDDLNSCKETVALDISLPRDRELFHGLVRKADGLIEGFRPKTKAKLGLDEKSLHAVNPRLCIASLVGYPENGPWRDRAGHDLNFTAISGCVSLFHEMPALPLADLFSAYRGALGLVAAMDAVSRDPAARGERVVISMAETLREVQTSSIAAFKATGRAPRPGETLFSGLYPCYRIYRAKDGRRIAVGAVERKFWEKVCSILGVPELVEKAYATGDEGRRTTAAVEAALSAKDWKEWAPLFDGADCCVEPVLDYPEIFDRGV